MWSWKTPNMTIVLAMGRILTRLPLIDDVNEENNNNRYNIVAENETERLNPDNAKS